MRPIDADAISYIQAIDATSDLDYVRRYNIDRMPTIDTTPIRQEQAIDFLQKSGWLPEHDKALTENAVPVVRCKDCRHRGKELCLMYYVDEGGFGYDLTRDSDYCVFGERKDDE